MGITVSRTGRIKGAARAAPRDGCAWRWRAMLAGRVASPPPRTTQVRNGTYARHPRTCGHAGRADRLRIGESMPYRAARIRDAGSVSRSGSPNAQARFGMRSHATTGDQHRTRQRQTKTVQWARQRAAGRQHRVASLPGQPDPRSLPAGTLSRVVPGSVNNSKRSKNQPLSKSANASRTPMVRG